MTEKETINAYVSEGRTILTNRGLAHAGAKLSWRDMPAKTNDAKKASFKKLIEKDFLEKVPTSGEIRAAAAAGQLAFETEDDSSPEEEAPEEEAPEGKSSEKFSEEVKQDFLRKSGAKRKRK